VSTSSEQFDPYRVWLGIPKAEQPPNHYRLLGVTLFESDPEVIQEGADRQVAHLKTKQTGARVQLSQKLLQQVVAAVGCLLDEQAKAKYDRQLREKLKPVAPPAETKPEPAKTEPVKQEAPVAAPQPIEQQPIPVVSAVPPLQPQYPQPQPVYLPPQPVYQQPIYQQPAIPFQPQPYLPPQSLRPIPVPVQHAEEPAEAESANDLPKLGGSLHSVSVRGSRTKNSSSDTLKFAAAGGVALIGLAIAWSVINQSGLLTDAPSKTPVIAKSTVKPKIPAKVPAVTIPQPVTPLKAEVDEVPPVTTTPPPTEPATANPATTPTDPAPSPTITPPSPMPMPPQPTPTGLTNPLASATPSVPSATTPAEKRLWRHSNGFIELAADGTWKELSPTGDYFTLTPIGSVTGDVVEFERPIGGRLRVFADRLEQATALGTFTDVAKGSWGTPADELEMETQQQATLLRACQLYADTLAKARRKLLDQFDDATSSLRKRIGKADERLAVITILEAEKARFEKEGLVSWSLPMQADTAKYLLEVQQARGPSEALFQKVVSHFVSRKDLDTARSVDALKHKVLAPLLIAKLTKTDVPRPPPMQFGFNPNRRRNDLPDDDGNYTDDPRTGTIRLWSNGAVNSAAGKSSWTIDMNGLRLQFMRTDYSIVDTITIGERGDELTGKGLWTNKFSLNFTGRFENSLEPHEHRPVVKFTPKLKPTTGAAEATE
jgi:hypothetical protein